LYHDPKLGANAGNSWGSIVTGRGLGVMGKKQGVSGFGAKRGFVGVNTIAVRLTVTIKYA